MGILRCGIGWQALPGEGEGSLGAATSFEVYVRAHSVGGAPAALTSPAGPGKHVSEVVGEEENFCQ